LPPQPSNDAEGWLMRQIAPGVWHHFPPSSGHVELGPAVDPLALPQHPRRPLKPSEVLREAMRRRSHDDGTWDR
jgi:hypothetical protein